MTRMILNEKTSELIGMHVGDGTLYRTSRGLVWELRGGLNEKDYYHKNVVHLMRNIFKMDFKPKFRSGGKNVCFGIQTSKVIVTNFFINCGFNPGRKTHSVRIPEYIRESITEIKLAFIRGYFDTDGCLRFDKDHHKIHRYPRIEIASASKLLMIDLSVMLTSLGFKYHKSKFNNRYNRIIINGRPMLNKWIHEVSPRNSKHLNKYYLFRKQGFVPPYVAVAQPGTAQT